MQTLSARELFRTDDYNNNIFSILLHFAFSIVILKAIEKWVFGAKILQVRVLQKYFLASKKYSWTSFGHAVFQPSQVSTEVHIRGVAEWGAGKV